MINYVKATTFLSLLFLLLFTNSISGQSNAPHIDSGVTFQWNNSSQPSKTSSASIKSVTINNLVYANFKAPSSYELTRLGNGGGAGHDENNIKLNGSTIISTSSNVTNWALFALNAFQDRNLNHYFESNKNGGVDICNDYVLEKTNTDSQRQTLTFANTIASAGSVLAVTERNANNCYHVRIFGYKANETVETVLGETFINTDGVTSYGFGGTGKSNDLGTVGTITAPTTNSDYWLADRVVDTGGTIGIALFHMENIVTIGSEISRIQLTGASADHGDGKIFIITTENYIDLDNDNDGLLDKDEKACTPIDAGPATGILLNTNVTNADDILDSNNGNGAQFDSLGDKFIIDLGSAVPAGTVLKIDASASNTNDKTITIEQSNNDGSSTSHIKFFTKESTSNENIDYILSKDTQYIKISMTADGGGVLYLNYLEIQPYDECVAIDTDGDGLPNHIDLDSDNDGITDVIEAGGIDTNGDGMADGIADATTNGIPDTALTGLTPIHTDNDGIPNHLDLDSDNDGIADVIEAGGTDSDNDGKADGIAETITDGIPSSAGTGLTPTTTDNDGIPNYLDLDSDNDGIYDIIEAGGTDTDNDGIADDLSDADNDGLVNIYDGYCNPIGNAIAVIAISSSNWSDQNNGIGIPGTTYASSNGTGTISYDLGEIIPAGTLFNFVVGTDSNQQKIQFNKTNSTGSETTWLGETPLLYETGPKTVSLQFTKDVRYIKMQVWSTGLRFYGVSFSSGDSDCSGSALTPIETSTGGPDYLNIDSDNDGCNDAKEAGFTDDDNDGEIDGSGFSSTGTVLNSDGYTGTKTDVTDSAIHYLCEDADQDGIPDYKDLDDDNDGILDSVENMQCGTDGSLLTTIFNEDFGTQSNANGTVSITSQFTNYEYFEVVTGTIASNSSGGLNDGLYSVFSDIQYTAPWAANYWQTTGDHTQNGTSTTSGRMAIFNAVETPAGLEFYRRTL